MMEPPESLVTILPVFRVLSRAKEQASPCAQNVEVMHLDFLRCLSCGSLTADVDQKWPLFDSTSFLFLRRRKWNQLKVN